MEFHLRKKQLRSPKRRQYSPENRSTLALKTRKRRPMKRREMKRCHQVLVRLHVAPLRIQSTATRCGAVRRSAV